MSPSTPTNDRSRPPAVSLPAPLKAGAFWAAVVLPFFTLAILVGGLETIADYGALAGLVVANVLALILGHDYGR